MDAPRKALLVDAYYDTSLGVVVIVRIVDGTLKKRQQVQMMKTGAHYTLDRVGVFLPGKLIDAEELGPGDVGFFTASIKTVADCSFGDTVTDSRKPTEEALPCLR